MPASVFSEISQIGNIEKNNTEQPNLGKSLLLTQEAEADKTNSERMDEFLKFKKKIWEDE